MEKLLKATLVTGLLLPQAVLAMPDAVKAKIETRQTARETRAEERKTDVAAKLDATKLKVCEKREARINAAIDRIATNSDRHLKNIDRFIDKTKAFYSKKQLTMADYESKLTGLAEARTEAEKSVKAIKELEDFSCDSGDPKGFLAKVRELRTAKHAAMKSYRQKAIDFMQSVKQAHSAGQKTEAAE